MAIARKELRVYIEKIVIFSVRTTYRSARDHPFIFSLVLFLLVLYRTSPLLFSLLISSSPVIICTTLLLGLLLSYGELNIPEIEPKDGEKSPKLSSLKVHTTVNDLYVERDEKFTVENHDENRESREDNITREAFLGEGITFGFISDEEIITTSQFITDESANSIMDAGAPDKVKEKVLDDLEKMIEMREIQSLEEAESRETFVERQGESTKEFTEDVISSSVENKELEGFRLDIDEAVQVHNIDSSLGSPWQHIGSKVEFSDSESDGGESSSPDASMADITPMLDELSPLLNSEHPQDVNLSKDDSDATSQGSLQDHELGDDSGEEEVEANEADDDAKPEEKDNDAEGAVKWTEDDQKNVMDLGSSEIERNRRLESLIARRRARKNLSFAMDRNLIDLSPDGSFASQDDLLHFPANIPPISAPRRNPFDIPLDQDEMLMPGSAPSLLARRNPFDMLDDPQTDDGSSEKESWGLQDFTSAQGRDMWFRRNETFNFDKRELGQVRRSSRLRPYFVPHRMDLMEEGSSAFERQFSGMSDSKVSTIPESDTVSSVADHDYRKELLEEELNHEAELASLAEHDAANVDSVKESSLVFERQFSGMSDSRVSTIPESDKESSVTDHDYRKEFIEQELNHEAALASLVAHDASQIDQRSESSDEDELYKTDLKRENLSGDHEISLGTHVNSQENYHKIETFGSEVDENREDVDLTSTTEYTKKFVLVEDWYDESSSHSLLSFSKKEEKGFSTTFQEQSANFQLEPDSMKSVLADSAKVAEPIYDSSPLANSRMSSSLGKASDDAGKGLHATSSLESFASKEILEDSWRSSEVTKVSSVPEDSKHYISSFTTETFAGDETVESASTFTTAMSSAVTIGKTEASHIYLFDLSHRTGDLEVAEVGVEDFNSTSLSMSKSDLIDLLSGDLSEFKDHTTATGPRKQLAHHIQTLNSSDEESTEISPKAFDHKDIEETLLSELDVVGDFHTEGLKAKEQSSALDLWTRNLGVDITSGSSSLDLHDEPPVPQASVDNSHEVQYVPSQLGASKSEFNYSFESSDVDFEQTVYNPKLRILQVKPEEEEEDDDSLSDDFLGTAMPLSFSESDLQSLVQRGSGQFNKTDLAKRYLERTPTVSELPSLEVSAEDTRYVGKIIEDYEENEHFIFEDGVESKSDLHIVEATTLGDIHSAFTELSDAKNNMEAINACIETEVIDVQTIDENSSFPLKIEGETSLKLEEHEQLQQSLEVQSDLQFVEPASLTDIHEAFKELCYPNSKEASSALDGVIVSKVSDKQFETDILEKQHINDNNLLPSEFDSEASLKVEQHAIHLNPMEMNSEMHGIEATSLLDLHSVFKDLSNAEIEEPAIALPELETSERELELQETEVNHSHSIEEIGETSSKAEDIKQSLEPTDVHSDLHVVEATSLVDGCAIFKELPDVHVENIAEEHIRQHLEPMEMHSDLHVVEAASLDDIHAIFKEPSNASIGIGAKEQIRQDPAPTEMGSELHHFEATSLDDIHAVFKELTNANVKKAAEDTNELEHKASEKQSEFEPDEELSVPPAVGNEASSQTPQHSDSDSVSLPMKKIVEKNKSQREKSRSISGSSSSSSSSSSDSD